MKRSIVSVAALVIGSAVLVGCDSSAVKPNGTSEQIAAYAAKVHYPTNMPATPTPTLFYMAGGDGTITIGNSSDNELDDLNVFVNQKYVVHARKLMPRSTEVITPDTLFDNQGSKFTDADNKTVSSVDLQSGSSFLRAMGPITPQQNQ